MELILKYRDLNLSGRTKVEKYGPEFINLNDDFDMFIMDVTSRCDLISFIHDDSKFTLKDRKNNG